MNRMAIWSGVMGLRERHFCLRARGFNCFGCFRDFFFPFLAHYDSLFRLLRHDRGLKNHHMGSPDSPASHPENL